MFVLLLLALLQQHAAHAGADRPATLMREVKDMVARARAQRVRTTAGQP